MKYNNEMVGPCWPSSSKFFTTRSDYGWKLSYDLCQAAKGTRTPGEASGKGATQAATQIATRRSRRDGEAQRACCNLRRGRPPGRTRLSRFLMPRRLTTAVVLDSDRHVTAFFLPISAENSQI